MLPVAQEITDLGTLHTAVQSALVSAAAASLLYLWEQPEFAVAYVAYHRKSKVITASVGDEFLQVNERLMPITGERWLDAYYKGWLSVVEGKRDMTFGTRLMLGIGLQAGRIMFARSMTA